MEEIEVIAVMDDMEVLEESEVMEELVVSELAMICSGRFANHLLIKIGYKLESGK